MFEDFLENKLLEIENSGLLRTLRKIQDTPASKIKINNRNLINFSSNNYLDLAGNKDIAKASEDIIEKYGFTTTSSRLVSGNFAIHEELEAQLADFKGKEAALVFPSGYQTNVGVISALMSNEKESCIIMDRLNHASLWDGAKLSGSRIFVYKHCNMNSLEKVFKRTREYKLKLVITESVFSMDGDFTPLKDFVELCKKHGAVSMVDEAHSTGVFGRKGKGLADVFGIEDKIDIIIGTLSKALATQGGFVCSSRKFIDFLINKSRAFIYTTAVSPAICAVALKSLEIVKNSNYRRQHLHAMSELLRNKLTELGFDISNSQSQIIPIVTGSIETTEIISSHLFEKGIYIPAIKSPTVPKNRTRIRIAITSGHTFHDIEQLCNNLKYFK